MHPKYLSIKDFSYHLPKEQIAQFPLENRDDSRLLISHCTGIQEDVYKNLANHLPQDCVLVLNNSKVMAARILFRKLTGSEIEIFCLEPNNMNSDVSNAIHMRNTATWKCMVGGAKKWKSETLRKKITLHGKEIELTARKIEKGPDHFIIEFNWENNEISFGEIMEAAGQLPLPPYMDRDPDKTDKVRYQTVYADKMGSVAAPTAGLHFTGALLDKLTARGIVVEQVTLHVGAATFKPVQSEIMLGHEMHNEYIEIQKTFVEKLVLSLQENKKIVAVGTTSLRVLESLYWLGKKIKAQKMPENLIWINQWEPYDNMDDDITSFYDSLTSTLAWMEDRNIELLHGKTQLLIAPGYSIQTAEALITNFHMPQSTLLLLVAAFAGDRWKEIYAYALQHNFRFLSYGDGCLLWRK